MRPRPNCRNKTARKPACISVAEPSTFREVENASARACLRYCRCIYSIDELSNRDRPRYRFVNRSKRAGFGLFSLFFASGFRARDALSRIVASPPGDFRFLFGETICGRSQGKSNSSNASSRVLYSRASNEIATDQRFEPKFYRTKERNGRRSTEAYANSTGDWFLNQQTWKLIFHPSGNFCT